MPPATRKLRHQPLATAPAPRVRVVPVLAQVLAPGLIDEDELRRID